MRQLLFLSILILLPFLLPAQTPDGKWTLEECIRHALEHNINLKQREQEEENRKISLHTSKHRWLPNLNAGVSQNFDFGRSPSNDGTIVDRTSANSSMYLQLNMPVFDGMEISNDIAAKKLDLLAATESLNKAREDLAINVASYYLQVLYNKEMQVIAELQAALSQEQVKRTESLVQAGKVPLSQLYDMKAQAAADEVSLTEANNNVSLALLDLAQSLELERNDKGFDIENPVTGDALTQYMGSILLPDLIYDEAVAFKPQIKEQEYLLESQKKQLNVARAGYYPKLNLSASYSNGYYHYYNEKDYINPAFNTQWRQNERKTVGLSLSIPIFNRFQVRNSVRSARVAISTRELMRDDARKVLYKEIQQAYYNATAAQEKYISSGKSVEAGKEAFTYAEERYNAGKSTV
ncbi:MAG: TolC family protein, partial [Tannerellaceae bacterium]|nr:TolC family protein [Tannerellaceae bacterium]